jgi:hypothetical protein
VIRYNFSDTFLVFFPATGVAVVQNFKIKNKSQYNDSTPEDG